MATLEYGDDAGDLFVFELFAMAAVVDDEAVVDEFNEVDEDVEEFDEVDEEDDDEEEDDEINVLVAQTNGPSALPVLLGVGVSLCWLLEVVM